MADQTIRIKFEAQGDKVLIKTVEELSKATKALIAAQVKLSGEGQKQFKTHNANRKAIRKLDVNLKALGSSIKSVGLDSKLYKDALRGNEVAMQKVRLAVKKYTADLTKNRTTMLGAVHDTRILGGSFAVLRSKLLIASFAFALIERTVVSLVKSFAQQEAVNNKLAVGLSNVEGTTEGVTQRLIDYSSALQKTTAFGDELITNGMVQLTTFGLNEEAIKALTPQVLNVARALQTTSGQMPDLNSLFIAFGKSTSTAVSALTRYGVVLTEAEKAQLSSMGANTRAVEISKILDKQYGGLAEAYAKTTAGMLEAASAARSDAGEAFGKVLAPAVLLASRAMRTIAESMNPERIRAYGAGIGLATVAAVGLAIATGKLNIKLMSSRAALVKSGWGLLVVVLGSVAGYLLDYFDVFKDGDNTLSDHEKRLKKAKEAAEELSKAQAEGEKSLRKQLELLSATSEEQKMLINLGHEASSVEKILIQKIIEKQNALDLEKERLKQAKKETEEFTKAKEAELRVRKELLQTMAMARADYASVMAESMELEGTLTELNSKKLNEYISFQRTLISAFGDRISVSGQLKDLSKDQADIFDSLNISLKDGNDLENAYLEILFKIFQQKMKNIGVADASIKEELSLREQLIGKLTEEQLKRMELSNIEQERAQIIISSVNQTTSAIRTNLNQRMQDEIDSLKKTSAYKNADAERRQDMEDKIARKYAKKQKALFRIEKAAKLADVYFNTASAVMKAVALSPLTFGQPWAGIAKALGVIQAGAILATPPPQAFAKGGEFVTNRPELIMVGEAGREHVKITPIDRPPERALGGGDIVLNISAPLVDETVVDKIIPAIEKATRLGLA